MPNKEVSWTTRLHLSTQPSIAAACSHTQPNWSTDTQSTGHKALPPPCIPLPDSHTYTPKHSDTTWFSSSSSLAHPTYIYVYAEGASAVSAAAMDCKYLYGSESGKRYRHAVMILSCRCIRGLDTFDRWTNYAAYYAIWTLDVVAPPIRAYHSGGNERDVSAWAVESHHFFGQTIARPRTVWFDTFFWGEGIYRSFK